MMVMITAREMKPLARILLQKAPQGLQIREIVPRIAPDDFTARGCAWMIDDRKPVVTAVFAPVEGARREEMIGQMPEALGDADWTAELAANV
jgi:hypothetical protein